MFACFAVFTITALDDFRFNGVFHTNSCLVPCIGQRGDRTTIRAWPWDCNARTQSRLKACPDVDTALPLRFRTQS
jgi:hypothetical protein